MTQATIVPEPETPEAGPEEEGGEIGGWPIVDREFELVEVLAGAAAGGLIGSAVAGPVGTVVGGIAGGAAGLLTGEVVERRAGRASGTTDTGHH
jgi:hypothetical protein